MPLAEFAATRLFEPLQLDGIGFATDITALPQTALLGPHLPLTHGGLGLWATARTFVQWLDHQNRDTLGIAALVTTPGRLNDGTPVDYGWGLGLRQHRGRPLLIHGGEWMGAQAKAVRSPELGVAFACLVAGTDAERLNDLVTAGLADAS